MIKRIAMTSRGWLAAATVALLAAAPAAAEPSFGVYALLNTRYNSSGMAPYTSSNRGGYNASPTAFTAQFVGLGVRYTVFPMVMLDVNGAALSNNPVYGNANTNGFPANAAFGNSYGRFDKAFFARATANFVSPSLMGLRVIAGVGAGLYKLQTYGYTSARSLATQLRVGLEYKPIPFVGLAIFENCDLPNITNGKDYYFNKYSLEPTLAVYF